VVERERKRKRKRKRERERERERESEREKARSLAVPARKLGDASGQAAVMGLAGAGAEEGRRRQLATRHAVPGPGGTA
jgi:hypothetical protein